MDCTTALQSALNGSGCIAVGARGGVAWPTRPLVLRSHSVVTFQPGSEIVAKAGEFHGPGDALFETLAWTTNVSIVGWGAVWRMRRADYADNRTYVKSEWRAGLVLLHSSFVRVEGLTIMETGGDGIYIIRCRDIVVHSCVLDKCYRQGISVIAASNLLVSNSTFSRTGRGPNGTMLGTPPMCGVDLEPDQSGDALVGVEFVDCVAYDNFGCGFSVALSRSTSSTPPLNVSFRRCTVEVSQQWPPPAAAAPLLCDTRGCRAYNAPGFEISAAFQTANLSQSPTGPGGVIAVSHCVVRNTYDAGIELASVASANLEITVSNSVFESVGTRSSPSELPPASCGVQSSSTPAPIVFSFDPGYATGDLHSRLMVSNLTVVDHRSRPWAVTSGCGGRHSLVQQPVTATIVGTNMTVRNSHGCTVGANVSLDLSSPVSCEE